MVKSADAIAGEVRGDEAGSMTDHGRVPGEFGLPRGDFGIDMLVVQLDGMFDGRPRRARFDAAQVVAALPTPQVGGQDPSCALLANLQHAHPRHALDLLLASLSNAARYLPTRIVLLWATLVWLLAGGCLQNPETSILGTPNTEAGLRCGLEAGLRALARATTDNDHRIRLVDLANHVRPRTWV